MKGNQQKPHGEREPRLGALPYKQLPTFVKALARTDGVAARALEFTILTAARTGEALGATWSEIDMINAVWTVPATRMKAGREHRVPLTRRATEILRELDEPAIQNKNHCVFTGVKGAPLSSMALLMVLRRMKQANVITHGFRSTFRDWAAAETVYAREVVEAALAHVSGDKVEVSLLGDFLDRRRKLMGDWDTYATGLS